MRLIELALANKADRAKVGTAKRAETLKQNKSDAAPVLSTIDKPFDEPATKHDTRADIAAEAGVSTGKIGMAEEYDAAQARGEVASAKSNRGNQWTVENDNEAPATAADLGLRRDEIHEARQFHNAEKENPGIVQGIGTADSSVLIKVGRSAGSLRCGE